MRAMGSCRTLVGRSLCIAGVALLLCSCRLFLDPGEYDGIAGGVVSGCSEEQFLRLDWNQVSEMLASPPGEHLVVETGSTYTLDTNQNGGADNNGEPVPAVIVGLPQSGAEQAAVLVVEGLTIEAEATLRATGTRPLIIASLGDVSIRGELDVSSTRAGMQGAGANSIACTESSSGLPGVSDSTTTHGPGGGGGSLGDRGGNGGHGMAGGSSFASGGIGGMPRLGLANDIAVAVFGGCQGGDGTTAGGGGGVAGGASGGAIQVSSCGTITVHDDAVIRASGAGGAGGATMLAGGAGGGSGGYIGLDAPKLVFHNATIVANGGAGGGGATNSGTSDGGEDGPDSTSPAAGGNNSGGSGGSRENPLGRSGQDSATSIAAGGGGGSVGVIALRSDEEPSLETALFSPAPLLRRQP